MASQRTSGTRIAMWSGPRNISTALMRAWGSRSDTTVCDEPLYAHYLKVTGREHPGREQVLRHHETDWRAVADHLLGPIPSGKTIFYQKHMAHHLLPNMERDWINELSNVFLIRNPREMLTSLAEFLPEPQLRDTGLSQQWALFQQLERETGHTPPVLDARDVLEHPREMLEQLCHRLGVPFRESMLSWEAGPRPTDGVWAKHWYEAVRQSTGFRPYMPKTDPVPERLTDLHRQCSSYYQRLYAHRLHV